jgi:hypothetical protein
MTAPARSPDGGAPPTKVVDRRSDLSFESGRNHRTIEPHTQPIAALSRRRPRDDRYPVTEPHDPAGEESTTPSNERFDRSAAVARSSNPNRSRCRRALVTGDLGPVIAEPSTVEPSRISSV